MKVGHFSLPFLKRLTAVRVFPFPVKKKQFSFLLRSASPPGLLIQTITATTRFRCSFSCRLSLWYIKLFPPPPHHHHLPPPHHHDHHQVMENNRPKLVSLSSRLREPIALCDSNKVRRRGILLMLVLRLMFMLMLRLMLTLKMFTFRTLVTWGLRWRARRWAGRSFRTSTARIWWTSWTRWRSWWLCWWETWEDFWFLETVIVTTKCFSSGETERGVVKVCWDHQGLLLLFSSMYCYLLVCYCYFPHCIVIIKVCYCYFPHCSVISWFRPI